MTRPTSDRLRIFPADAAPVASPADIHVPWLPGASQAFERATGWSLRFTPGQRPPVDPEPEWTVAVDAGDGFPVGYLQIDAGDDALTRDAAIELEATQQLAASFARALGDALRMRRVLRDREAELAACLPVGVHRAEADQLALRLEAVLRGGAEAVDCQAAGLYLLDDATSTLKLRAAWQLPAGRFTDPPRQLRDAMADLEALAGHAVVLENRGMFDYWRPPEKFGSAVCVPVASPTMPLGTLWMFSEQARTFTDHETNLAEIVAGRLAADLEREVLFAAAHDATRMKREWTEAQRWIENQSPKAAPWIDGWELAGWTCQSSRVAGDFHDWFLRPDNSLAVVVGDTLGRELSAALAAGALKSAVRAHAQYGGRPHDVLERVNHTLWTTSAGDQSANLFYASVNTETGDVGFSAAGEVGAMLLRRDGGCESLAASAAPLAAGPEPTYETRTCRLAAGDVLVAATSAVRDASHGSAPFWNESTLRKMVAPEKHRKAADVVELLRRQLESDVSTAGLADRTLLVLRRDG